MRRIFWQDRLFLIRRYLDDGAHLRFPDVNGDWYLSHSVELADGGMLRASGFNQPTPARCIDAAWKELTSGKTLRLRSGARVAFDGERFSWAPES